jgi:beta-galactosidase
MGVTVKEYVPIYSEKIGVKFSAALAGADGECRLWADTLQISSASVLATYTGPYSGDPAITSNKFGKGQAVYVGADLDAASLARVLGSLLDTAGIQASFGLPPGVEMTTRKAGNRQWIFLLNHTPDSQEVTLPGQFKDLLTGATQSRSTSLKPYDVLVLQPA